MFLRPPSSTLFPYTTLFRSLLVGGVAVALATTGTFERLISLAIVWILVIDGWAILALFRLRQREPMAPFRVPLYPWVPLALLGVYGALLVGTAVAQPVLIVQALAVLVGAYGLSWAVEGGRGR